MQGFSHWGSAKWDLRLHLNEALTILPFTGWSGRQLSTSGFTGSFSPFLERLRSFAICKEDKIRCSCEFTWKQCGPWCLEQTLRQKRNFLYNDKHTGRDYWQRSLRPNSYHCFCGSLHSSSTDQCIIWPLPGLLLDFSLTHTHNVEKE